MADPGHRRDPQEPDAPADPPRPAAATGPAPRRVLQEPGGPTLVEGPVEVVMDDGRTARSDRPVVAVCTCHRSAVLPWCDTSHRGHRPRRPGPGRPDGKPGGPNGGQRKRG